MLLYKREDMHLYHGVKKGLRLSRINVTLNSETNADYFASSLALI